MRMDHIKRLPLHLARGDVCCGASECRKAPPIVGPVLARCIAIRPALTREIGGGVEDEERVAVEFSGQQARRFTE